MKNIQYSIVICLLLGALTACGSRQPSASGLSPTPVSALGVNVVRAASTQVGKPYRLGGNSPREGFDCSGLIHWAFAQNGVLIPRRTSEQAGMGQPIPKNALQPGDIMVFRSSASPNGLHTAIYMGGDKMIHSPNKKSKVRVESMKTPHWEKTYLLGRRVVPVRR